MGEKRVVNETTGGEKGQKSEQMTLLPLDILMEDVAPLYAAGAEKYSAHNWRKGHAWSLSGDALLRHFTQFWHGEQLDAEMQEKHLACVVFHALTLLYYDRHFPQFDDRPDAVSTMRSD